MRILPPFVLLATAAIARAQSPVTDAMRDVFPTHEQNLVGAFERMPAEKFGYKAMPELMTFGELAVHITSANLYYCRRLSGTSPAPRERVTPTSTKAQLVAALKASFDFCRPLVAHETDAALGENIPSSPSPAVTRASVMLAFFSGMDHHYAQAASYLRMNGLLPPTATGK